MARTKATKEGINKSEEIRKLLRENPKAKAKDIQAQLAQRDIKVSGNLIYLLKSKMYARKRRQRRATAVKAVSANGHGDALALIRKVKALAAEVGGMNKLKGLIEALSE
jgi:hypothetical protein